MAAASTRTRAADSGKPPAPGSSGKAHPAPGSLPREDNIVTDQDRSPAVIQGTVVERLQLAKRHPVVPAWIRDETTRRAAG